MQRHRTTGSEDSVRGFGLVIPVFNDWGSLETLLSNIDKVLEKDRVEVDVFVVNDGSSEQPVSARQTDRRSTAIRSITTITLPFNMGHQRAIAIGLAHVAATTDCAAVLVMDADGEDRPEDVPRLISTHIAEPDTIIVAQRTKRSESVTFKALYGVYKWLFRILTGNKIDFGNFSLIPRSILGRLVDTPETWNHLAATYVRTPVRRITIPTTRGHRYTGVSRMNLPSLVFHAICAMSVFADVLFARILIATSALAAFCVVVMIGVLYLKLFTDLAIPGWTTNAVGLLFLLFVQLLILMLGAAFLLVNHRSNLSGSPAMQYKAIAPQVATDGLFDRTLDAAKR